jgi:hypothetical protein
MVIQAFVNFALIHQFVASTGLSPLVANKNFSTQSLKLRYIRIWQEAL